VIHGLTFVTEITSNKIMWMES